MTEAEYAAKPGVRWSHLKRMAKSALHYRAAVDGLFGGETRALRLGRALHSMLIEPDTFNGEWVCWAGQRRGKKWEDFAEANADRSILTWTEMSFVTNAAAAVRRHRVALEYLGGARELFVTWLDEETGLRCKARIDLLAADRLVDLKSSAAIDPFSFGRLAARLGYHAQLAFYLDGLVANGVVIQPEPILIAVEMAIPFDVVPYELSLPVMEAGRREYRRLLLQVAECEARGEWPGRSPASLVQLEIPDWAYGGFDDGLDPAEPGSVFE